ncbi:hypothetical protein [Coleofasciculus sp. E2-BRE-01]
MLKVVNAGVDLVVQAFSLIVTAVMATVMAVTVAVVAAVVDARVVG